MISLMMVALSMGLLSCSNGENTKEQEQQALLDAEVKPETPAEKDARMAWWRAARFGMFIHWGVYSQWGGVYHGHQQAKGGAEWIMNRSKIPVAEYRDSARSFNPVNYDPDAIVRLAKEAGMKYIIITAKHHDGFALFDSKASDWDVVDATAYGKDLLKPLAEACRKHGLKLGFYYSQAQDWTNPGGTVARKLMREGWPNPDSAKIDAYTDEHQGHWDPAQMTRSFDDYIDQVAIPQVKEILTNYGDIAVLWWDTPVRMTEDAATKLQRLLKLQPGIITNDRLKRPDFPGDTKTPEQKIPKQSQLDGQDWETCMTINSSWGYKSWDHNWKSSSRLIRNLVDIASKGGNYLLNIGPKADGSVPEESVERLKDIGKWMKVNGHAIYGSQPSPLRDLDWGRCTVFDEGDHTKLNLFVFDWPGNQRLVVPNLDNKVVRAQLITASGPVALTASNNGGNIEVELPSEAPDSVASLVELTVTGEVTNVNVKADKEMETGALD